jgi:hypothetical protein
MCDGSGGGGSSSNNNNNNDIVNNCIQDMLKAQICALTESKTA